MSTKRTNLLFTFPRRGASVLQINIYLRAVISHPCLRTNYHKTTGAPKIFLPAARRLSPKLASGKITGSRGTGAVFARAFKPLRQATIPNAPRLKASPVRSVKYYKDRTGNGERGTRRGEERVQNCLPQTVRRPGTFFNFNDDRALGIAATWQDSATGERFLSLLGTARPELNFFTAGISTENFFTKVMRVYWFGDVPFSDQSKCEAGLKNKWCL